MKILKISLLTIAAATALLFTACNREDSASVDQSKIWLFHSLDYDANTGLTTASAQFRFSNGVGTLLELSDDAVLTINGADPEFVNALVLYRKISVGVQDSAVFVYTDIDNNTFTNTVQMIDPIDLPANINGANISKSSAYEVDFVGNNVGDGEAVTVYIKENNGTDWKAFVATQNAGSVFLTTNQLNGLNTGSAQIKIERYKAGEPTQDPGKGGLIWSKYGSAVKTVNITN